ncbi:peptidase inhibitor 16-like [Physella acuta]|uniref:peptidase inhibitor 16-like n=1 Tax=Physella acuta TaxID=109671 RepID=UPI0027DD6B5E|nr:peptidase inhibitor 16-like [Physella acuta]XP_059156955.1 peptidase inhibitor 16-like [Physella acuta]
MALMSLVQIVLSLVLTCQSEAQSTLDPTASVVMTTESGFDEQLRAQMLTLNNEYRQDEYEAGDMNKLDWSPLLEAYAANHTEKCDFRHQENSSWGENLYRSTDAITPLDTIFGGMQAWHLEHYNIKQSPSGYVDCCSETKKTCCHFTQLVWARTEYVGCAMKKCATLTGEIVYTNAWFMACYYYPPGNVLTEQPYQRTSAGQCSLCGPTNPDCDNGLCYFDTKRC